MPDHYDALETRDPAVREREQAAELPAIVARAMTAPGWAKHLKGIDPKSVNSRAALAKLPVLRKADVAALQKENPPFGGFSFCKAATSALRSTGSLASVAREFTDFGSMPWRCLAQPGAVMARATIPGSAAACSCSRTAGSRVSRAS